MRIHDADGALLKTDFGQGNYRLLVDGTIVEKYPPLEASPEQQVETLRHMLQDPALKEHHHNIRTLIRLYERERLPPAREGT